MILGNKRGLRGEATHAVVLSLTFMNAVFNMEKNFQSGSRYSLTGSQDEQDRTYLLDHLTSADLQLAFILQKSCYTDAILSGLTALSNIYDKLCDYFEDPIGRTQFYASLEKFKLHGLIEIKNDHASGTLSVQLNHYLSDETGKIGAYVKGHPFLFSKAFSQLTLCAQKLFLTFYIQQGVRPESGRMTFRMFSDTASADIQYSSIQRFLHCSPTHVRLALESLQSASLKNIGIKEQLLSHARLEKKRGSRSFERIWVSISPYWYQVEETKEFHDPIGLRITYKKKANMLQRLLNDYKIGEIITSEQGRVFQYLVRLLRHESGEVLKFIVKRLHDLYITKQLSFRGIIPFVQNELRHRFKARVMAMAQTQGLEDLITAGHRDTEQNREEREFDFASAMSRYSERTIRSLFLEWAGTLKAKYMRPIRENDLHYQFDARLDEVNGITLIRKTAIKHYKVPSAYLELETEAAVHYEKNIRELEYTEGRERYLEAVYRFRDWMIDQINGLPDVWLVPQVWPGFRLETILLNPEILPTL